MTTILQFLSLYLVLGAIAVGLGLYIAGVVVWELARAIVRIWRGEP